jgi:starvation-inducible DNA-binding protein
MHGMSNHTAALAQSGHPTLGASDVELIGEQLQAILAVLVDLELTGKQAHWNVAGRRFRPLHLFLDELVDTWRDHTDQVAERMRAVGAYPDGRARTVADTSGLRPLAAGRLQDDALVVFLIATLTDAVAAIRPRMDSLEDVDAVTADLLHTVVAALEEQRWMLLDWAG